MFRDVTIPRVTDEAFRVWLLNAAWLICKQAMRQRIRSRASHAFTASNPALCLQLYPLLFTTTARALPSRRPLHDMVDSAMIPSWGGAGGASSAAVYGNGSSISGFSPRGAGASRPCPASVSPWSRSARGGCIGDSGRSRGGSSMWTAERWRTPVERRCEREGSCKSACAPRMATSPADRCHGR